jgi:phosphomevalonate kinase
VKVVARAPAKLVLFGEYAVLAGAPAVVAAVDRFVTATITPSDGAAWTFASDLPGKDARTRLAALVDAYVDPALGLGGHLEVTSAPLFSGRGGVKLGLGSSGAVVVAVGAALRELLERRGLPTRAPETRLHEDIDVHARLQGGRGSGVDVAASFHGGVIAWWQDRRFERLRLPDDLRLVCVFTGRSASTRDYIDAVDALAESDPAGHAAALARLAARAHDALDALRTQDTAALCALADEYRLAMAGLGERSGTPIVSEPHRVLASVARAAGCGYKPSGAGGGDIGLIFAASPDAAARAADEARAAGFEIVELDVHASRAQATTSEGAR